MYLKVVEIQKMQSKKDLFAYRRLYFTLNNCGRMKVMLKQYSKALKYYDEALMWIGYLKENSIKSDGYDKENYRIILKNSMSIK